MRTSISKIDDSLVVTAKFDNSDTKQAWTLDELTSRLTGLLDAYELEQEDEEALLALIGAVQAAAQHISEGEVYSQDDK